MTIQQIHIFQVLCHELNYTRAAANLYMTRQAVKQNITALESELGGALFLNERNHISLTEKGAVFQKHSLPVWEAYERLQKTMIHDLKISKPIKLGISVSLIPDFLPDLPDVLERFQMQFPNLEIELLEQANDAVVRAVQESAYDAGLIMDLGAKAVIPHTARYEIVSCALACMVERHHPLWDRTSLTLEDINGETIQIPGKSDAFSPLFREIRQKNYHIQFEISPHYYQVYYKVRDAGILGLNRYFPPENESPESTRDIPLKSAPPLCAALITSENKKSGMETMLHPLVHFLRKEYRAKPFVRQTV